MNTKLCRNSVSFEILCRTWIKRTLVGAVSSLCLLTLTPWTAQAQPQLGVQHVPEGVRISWPLSAADFVLQGTPALDPAEWLDIANSPEIVGQEFEVIINLGSEERFFRLANLPFPSKLPTLRPSSETAFSNQQVQALLKALGADPGDSQADPRGWLFLLDPNRFQVIPSEPVTDPQIIEILQRETEEGQNQPLLRAFDMEKLRNHRPLGLVPAIQRTMGSLKEAGLLPDGARPVPSHTRLMLLDEKGSPMMGEVLIDTHVNLELFHKSIPLSGPGARIGMTFDPEGALSHLLFSYRPMEEGDEVEIMDERTAMEKCALLYPKEARVFKPRLLYFAPSVLEGDPKVILPCFECAASSETRGETLNLIRRIIPATEDANFLPAVQLTGQLEGRTVLGEAIVTGGLPPYRFKWISSSADLSDLPEDKSSVEYVVGSPNETRGPEVLQVIVVDANGIEASAMEVLGVASFAGPSMGPQPAAAVTDFGVERAVSDMGSALQSGFVNRFKQSAMLRFNFSGVGAWERDFRQGGTGLDHLFVDNVDLALYIGHGWPGGFTFESMQNDDAIVPGDVVGAWGNNDLEWLCLVSCQVLKWSSGGQNVVQRWGPAFDRLHMLLGFDTNANDWSGFGASFANYALGYNMGFYTLPPFPIRHAWFLAKRDQQPASVVAAAMGPIGPGGATNCDEYFWGKGPVGPDISKNNIQGWWVLYYK